MKVNRLNELIADRQKNELISSKESKNKINKYKIQIQAVKRNQAKSFMKHNGTKLPKEVIVVFSRLNFKKDCLDDYSKYSYWWSSPKSMPENLKLRGKYSFKVKPAPEPYEINLE